MILVCGIPSEGPVARVIDAAESIGIDVAVFNQRHVHAAHMIVDLDETPVGALHCDGRDIDLDTVAGVYTRLIDSGDIPENQSRPGDSTGSAARAAHSAQLHASLEDWLELSDCRVVNRTSSMASNASKPYQAQLIMRAGFRTPETIVTNDPDAVRDFVRRHGRVIYKSTSSVRSIVRELTPSAMDRIDDVRRLPTQFQEYIDGENVRVHVVGDAVFPTAMHTEALDYRYAHRDDLEITMTAAELPPDIEARCVALAKVLALPLCGIDLKRTSAGDYVCFEVNPSPAFSYYEDHTEQPIAAAIARYLETGVALEA